MNLKPATLQELFADESRWTQGAHSRNKSGVSVFIENDQACSWCIWGGCILIYGQGSKFDDVWDKLTNVSTDFSPISYNDTPTTTIDDIRRVCREAGV